MSKSGEKDQAEEIGDRAAKLLAFYLPQYHPIPENDEWWGPGFTEWRNVMRAKPSFPGHYQPHVPGELGFYDLRVPEVRQKQADLAREYGIHGFCYYHYWFNGKRLLETPFNEVLESGSPDFPFLLCWANEEWTRNWDAQSGRVLIDQKYSDEDDLAHIRYLIKAFEDPRYMKIDGRPMLLVYRAKKLPNAKRTTDLWRSEAQKAGFPDLYLCKVESHGDFEDPHAYGFDANVSFFPKELQRVTEPFVGFRENIVIDYPTAAQAAAADAHKASDFRRFPAVMPSWDNTARRKSGAAIFSGSSPEIYEKWLKEAIDSNAVYSQEENIVFIVAWNEWAEGNHLEPDERYGRRYLEATRRALRSSAGLGSTAEENVESEALVSIDLDDDNYSYIYDYAEDGSVGHAVKIARDVLDVDRAVVDLGAGAAVIQRPLQELGFRYYGMDSHPEALRVMRSAGIDARDCDLNDEVSLVKSLNDLNDDIGSIFMLDVIEHLVEPQRVLAQLSNWALDHGSPYLVISVPNVAHFDIGLNLLMGRWDVAKTGLLDSTHLRFFYKESLARMCERTGWKIVAENDVKVIHSDQYVSNLEEKIPASVIGALRVLSDNFNEAANVNQFVWALAPVGTEATTPSYLSAVGKRHGKVSNALEEEELNKRQHSAMLDYMQLVSVFTVEHARTNRSLESLLLQISQLEELDKHKTQYIDELLEHVERFITEDEKKANYIDFLGVQVNELNEAVRQLETQRDALAADVLRLQIEREQIDANFAEVAGLLHKIRSRRSYRVVFGVIDHLPVHHLRKKL